MTTYGLPDRPAEVDYTAGVDGASQLDQYFKRTAAQPYKAPSLESYYSSRASTASARGLTTSQADYKPPGAPFRFTGNILDDFTNMAVASPLGVAGGLSQPEQRGGTVDALGLPLKTAPVNIANAATYAREAPLALITSILGQHYQKPTGGDPYAKPEGLSGNTNNIFENIGQANFPGVIDNLIDGVGVVGDAINAPFKAGADWARNDVASGRAEQVAQLILTGHGQPSIIAMATHILDINSISDMTRIHKAAVDKGVTDTQMLADLWNLSPEVVDQIKHSPTMTHDQFFKLTEGQPFSYKAFENLIGELGVTLAPMVIGAGELRGIGALAGALRGGRTLEAIGGAEKFGTIAPLISRAIGTERAAVIGERLAAIGASSASAGAKFSASSQVIGMWSLPNAWRFVRPVLKGTALVAGVSPNAYKLGAAVRIGEWMFGQAGALMGNQAMIDMADRWLFETPLSDNPGLQMADAFVVHPLRQAKAIYTAGRETTMNVIGHGEVGISRSHAQALGTIADMPLDELHDRVLTHLGWDKGTVKGFFESDHSDMSVLDLKNGLYHIALQVVRDRHPESRMIPAGTIVARAVEFVRRYGDEASALLRDEASGRGHAIADAITDEFWTRSRLAEGSSVGMLGSIGPYDPHTALVQFASWIHASKFYQKAFGDEYVPALRTDVNTEFLTQYRADILGKYKPNEKLSAGDINRLVTFVPIAKATRGIRALRPQARVPKITQATMMRFLDELEGTQRTADANLALPRTDRVPSISPEDAISPDKIAPHFNLRADTVRVLMEVQRDGVEGAGPLPADLVKVLRTAYRMNADEIRRDPAKAWTRAVDWFENQYSSAVTRGQAVDITERFGRRLATVVPSGDLPAVNAALERVAHGFRHPYAAHDPSGAPVPANIVALMENRSNLASEFVGRVDAWLNDPRSRMVARDTGDGPVLETKDFTAPMGDNLRILADKVLLADAHATDPALSAVDRAMLADPNTHIVELNGILQRATQGLDASDEAFVRNRPGDFETAYGDQFAEVADPAADPTPITRAMVDKLTKEVVASAAERDALVASAKDIASVVDHNPRATMLPDLADWLDRAGVLGTTRIGAERGPKSEIARWRGLAVDVAAVDAVSNEDALTQARVHLETRVSNLRDDVISAERAREIASERLNAPLGVDDFTWAEAPDKTFTRKADAQSHATLMADAGVPQRVAAVVGPRGGKQWGVFRGDLKARPEGLTPAEVEALKVEVGAARDAMYSRTARATFEVTEAERAAEAQIGELTPEVRSTKMVIDAKWRAVIRADPELKRIFNEGERGTPAEQQEAIDNLNRMAREAAPPAVRARGDAGGPAPVIIEKLAEPERIVQAQEDAYAVQEAARQAAFDAHAQAYPESVHVPVEAPAVGSAVGDLVKFKMSAVVKGKPGTMNSAGTVTKLLPDGGVEVRLQAGGYHTLARGEFEAHPTRHPERGTTPVKFYRQSSLEQVNRILGEDVNVFSQRTYAEDLHLSTSREFALGQGANADGVLMEFADMPVREGGGVGAQMMGAVVGDNPNRIAHLQPDQIKDRLVRVTIPKAQAFKSGTRRAKNPEYYALLNNRDRLAKAGWSLTETPEGLLLERAADAPAAPRPAPVEVTFLDPMDNKTPIRSHVVIVDAANVLTSADEAYPSVFQPRSRGLRVESDRQIAAIAKDLQPSKLFGMTEGDAGTPILSPDGFVISGNGRTQGIRLASEPVYRAYKEALRAEAVKYGFDPAILDTMDRPVLFRQLEGVDPVAMKRLAWQLNGKGFPIGDLAVAFADEVKAGDLEKLKIAEKQDLRDALTADKNTSVVDAIIAKMPPDWRNTYIGPDGRPSEAGTKLVEGAIFAKLLRADVPGPHQDAARDLVVASIEQGGEEMRRVFNGVYGAAAAMLKAQARADAGTNGIQYLATVETLSQALTEILRRRRADTTMGQIAVDLQTIDAFAEFTVPAQVGHLGALLASSTQSEIGAFLRGVANATEQNASVGMFEEAAPVTTTGLLNSGMRAWNAERAKAGKTEFDNFPSGDAPHDTAITVSRDLPDGNVAPPVLMSVPLQPGELAGEVAARTLGPVVVHAETLADARAATESPAGVELRSPQDRALLEAYRADPEAVGADIGDAFSLADSFTEPGARIDYLNALIAAANDGTIEPGDWAVLKSILPKLRRNKAGKFNEKASAYAGIIPGRWAMRTHMTDRLDELLWAEKAAPVGTESHLVDVPAQKALTEAELHAVTGPDVPHVPADPIAADLATTSEHTITTNDNPTVEAAVRKATGAPAVAAQGQRAYEFNAPNGVAQVERLAAIAQARRAALAAEEQRLKDFQTNPPLPATSPRGSVFSDPNTRGLWDRLMLSGVDPIASAVGSAEPRSLAEVIDAIQSIDRGSLTDPVTGVGITPEEAPLLRADLMRIAEGTLTTATGRVKDSKAKARNARVRVPDDFDAEGMADAMDKLTSEVAPLISTDPAIPKLDGFAGTQYFPSPPTGATGEAGTITPRLPFRDWIGSDLVPGLKEELESRRMMEPGERIRRSRALSAIEHLIGPRSQRAMTANAVQIFHDQIERVIGAGEALDSAQADQLKKAVDQTIQAWRDHLERATIAPLPFSIFRRIDLMGPKEMNRIMGEEFAKAYPDGFKALGGETIAGEPVLRGFDASPIWRQADNRIRQFLLDQHQPLSTAIEHYYGKVADGKLGTASRWLNVVYHITRFTAEFRWLALEVTEPIALGLFHGGLQVVADAMSAKRAAAAGSPLGFGGMARRNYFQESAHWTRAGDIEQVTPLRQRVIMRMLQQRQQRPFREAMMEALAKDPQLTRIMTDLGDTPNQFLHRLDRDYQLLEQGAHHFTTEGEAASFFKPWLDSGVIDEAKYAEYVHNKVYSSDPRIEAELLKTNDPVAHVLYSRLAQINHDLMHDLTGIFFGQENRSNLQRVLNHPFLYWPISYQIKATKWLARFMGEEAFGIDAGMLPAVALQRVYERHKELMATSPQYRKDLSDNATLYFLASMFLPIAPWDIGVSLSPWTRQALSIAGLGPDYQRPFGAFGFGQFSTYGMAARLIHEKFGADLPFLEQIAPVVISTRSKPTSRVEQAAQQAAGGSDVPYVVPEVPRLP